MHVTAGFQKSIQPIAPPGRQGFTLVEVMIVAAISLVVIGGATMAMVNAIRGWRAEGIRSDLHMDLEIALTRIQQDLRLSSVGEHLMAFYPTDGREYTAISFPLATPDPDTGLLPRDEDNKIKWDTTVIYHVRPGSPDELIRTTFSPRNPDAEPHELQEQLEITVASANTAQIQERAAMTYTHVDDYGMASAVTENVESRVIFSNLVEMRFRPPVMYFDGYAPQYQRARRINWGSLILGSGTNTLTFTVMGRNTNSVGYNVGIDHFALSRSGSLREGEIVLPVDSHPVSPFYVHEVNCGTVIAEDMSSHGASWSGNCQLTFQPPEGDEQGSRITFEVANDLWCDTNFDTPPGVRYENCSRKYDRTFTNYFPHIPDFVVSMDDGISWDVLDVTTDPAGVTSFRLHQPYGDDEDELPFTNVVNVIKGRNDDYPATRRNGALVRFLFRAGPHTGGLAVRNPRIRRRNGGSEHNLYFDGLAETEIPRNESAWTDWLRFEIDRDESYELLWQRDLGDGAARTSVAAWPCPADNVLSLIDGDADVFRGYAVGFEAMEVRVPSNAVYRSGVFDTRIASPTYRNLVWTPYVPSDCEGEILLRVRSADRSDMRDEFGNEVAWYPPSGSDHHIGNAIGSISGGRYVQYEALFSAWGEHRSSPKLRDVTITWDASMGIVDLNVDFARGPDYGIVTVDVNDGQLFIKGIEVDMEIFREGPYGEERVSGSVEVRPLNTGR